MQCPRPRPCQRMVEQTADRRSEILLGRARLLLLGGLGARIRPLKLHHEQLAKMRVINALALAILLLATAGGTSLAQDKSADATASIAVGAQYDTAHVYVAPADLDRFSDSLIATFGGTKSQQATLTVTPTPSKTMWRAVFTPVCPLSGFGFTKTIPCTFDPERNA